MDDGPVNGVGGGGGAADKGGGRWLRVALAVSVALNLAVAGAVIGARWREGPPRAVSLRDAGLGPFAAALAEEDRVALRRALVARSGELRAARAEMRRGMAEVAALIRAEPFDAAAVRAAMARESARMGRVIALGQDLIVDHVAGLPVEARRAFADRLEAAARRGPRGIERRPRPER